jgi:4-oxalomesaconate tautomerase
MTLIAPPREHGTICTRSFIPHVCHEAIGVLAAVTVATACVLPGSITEAIAAIRPGNPKNVSVEHPSGEFSVELEVDPAQPHQVRRAALLRTARLLMRGQVMIPASIWKGPA